MSYLRLKPTGSGSTSMKQMRRKHKSLQKYRTNVLKKVEGHTTTGLQTMGSIIKGRGFKR